MLFGLIGLSAGVIVCYMFENRSLRRKIRQMESSLNGKACENALLEADLKMFRDHANRSIMSY